MSVAEYLSRAVVRLGLVLAVFVGGAPSLAAQISIQQLELHVRIDDSRTLTQVIPVISESDSSQQLRVSLKDWTRDSIGANQFHDYESTDGSCRERLQVFPATTQIGPKATEFLRVTY